MKKINLGGINLVYNNSETKVYNNLSNFLRHLANSETFYELNENNSAGICGDFFHFSKNGTLFIKSKKYLITDIAFNQIINYFGFSKKKLAKLVLNAKLVDYLNELFISNFNTKFYVKVLRQNRNGPRTIVGFHSNKLGMLIDSYIFCSNLLYAGRMSTMDTSFITAHVCDYSSYIYLLFNSEKSSSSIGVEITHSSTALIKPSINCIIYDSGAVMRIKDLSFKLSLELTNLDKYLAIIETTLSNISLETPRLISLVKKSKTKIVTDSMNNRIRNRVKKSIGSIEVNLLGLTIFDAIKKISILSEGSNKVRTAMFLGDLLTF